MAFYNQKVKDGVQRELMTLHQNISLAISQPHNWGREGGGDHVSCLCLWTK